MFCARSSINEMVRMPPPARSSVTHKCSLPQLVSVVIEIFAVFPDTVDMPTGSAYEKKKLSVLKSPRLSSVANPRNP